MEALSVREYRNNLAASFTKADNGEQVLIRRKNEIYALVKVGREDLISSLALSILACSSGVIIKSSRPTFTKA